MCLEFYLLNETEGSPARPWSARKGQGLGHCGRAETGVTGSAGRVYSGICFSSFLNTSGWLGLTRGGMFAEHQGGGTAHCQASTGGQQQYNRPALAQQVLFPAGQVQPHDCLLPPA